MPATNVGNCVYGDRMIDGMSKKFGGQQGENSRCIFWNC